MSLPVLTAATWSEVSALLDEVLALPPEARDGFVEALGGERAVHRDTLRALLAQSAAVETGDFLATLPRLTRVAAAPAGALTELSAGDSIGPYRLLSELGTGGMGAVWLAERSDGQLKRKVALKLPRLVWAKGLAERMARERDILATLEHPNIARLYDAGVDQHGRPYLALEYVEGQPIDVYARERGLSVRQKLDLLLQVCSAVAFAHSRLVVHRDLKPSNILVTADGQVRLLDFGIAKLMEGDSAKETQLTQLAGRALTLDYASPEQIKGEPIGTASDVYSLGVVAYELLTGAKPYKLKRGTPAELEEAIATADIAVPSARSNDPAARRALRGDLDAILTVALAPQLARRYAGASSFSDDLRRHLSGHAVTAREAPWAERLVRLVKRRPTESAVTAGVVVALVGGFYAQAAVVIALAVGTALALWQRRRAMAERDAAQRERRRAEGAAAAERVAAARAEEQARRANEVKHFVLSLFELADADRGAGIDTTAVQLLSHARARIDRELTDQPAVAFELKVALATSLSSLGDRAGAREVLASLVGHGSPTPECSAETVRARLRYADVLNDAGESDQALAQLRMAQREAADGDWPDLQVEALRHLALRVGHDGIYEQAVALAQSAVDASQTARVSDLVRMRAWSALANTRFAARKAGVRDAAGRAIEIGERLYPDQIGEPLLEARQLYASGLLLEGLPLEAIDQLQKLIQVRTEVLGASHLALSTPLHILANAQISAGDPDGALATIADFARITRENDSGPTLRSAVVHFRSAMAHEMARRWQDAVEAYRRALELAAQVENLDPAMSVSWRSGLAHALARSGAIEDVDATPPSLEQHPLADAFDALIRHRHFSVVHSLCGRHELAVAMGRASVDAASTATPMAAAISNASLGWVLVNAGFSDLALPPLRAAEEQLVSRVYPTSPDLIDCRHTIGRALLEAGDLEAAVATLQACEAFWSAQRSAKEAPRVRADLALALDAAGNASGAAALAQQVIADLSASARADDRMRLQRLRSLRGSSA